MSLPAFATLENIAAARRDYFEHGREATGLIDSAVYRSWSRCMATSRRTSEPVEYQAMGRYIICELVQSNQLLLEAAMTPLADLEQAVARAGYTVLLTDSRGVALSVGGALEQQHQSIRSALRQGVDLSERAIGTSAMACALHERRPVRVFGPEHFFSANEIFHCAAAPIIDPHGNIIGTVDITRGSPHPDFGALSLVARCAHAIEYGLFGRIPAKAILSLSWQPHSSEPYADLILALGADGEVLAANETARRFIGFDAPGMALGFEDIFEGRFGAALAAMRRSSEPLPIRLRSGICMFASLWQPQRAAPRAGPSAGTRPAVSPRRVERNVASGSEALAALARPQSRLGRALTLARNGLDQDLPVLLLGETGTGKEVVARVLHEAGVRAGKPFVAVNCASLPEGLIESELFGYRDGAFTGARKGGAVGRLMQANGGTLFLDEIGDMPQLLQARLLRVLQERKVAPLGAGEEQAIDVAVICATHRDLPAMVHDKTFRADLYYRINGVTVALPPLRERDDLPDLIAALLARLGAAHLTLSAELTDLFRRYSWPGNIRQLEMVLRTALVMCEEDEQELGVQHLNDSFHAELLAASRPAGGLVHEQELELIRTCLDRHQGKVTAAAQELGIGRATLYRRLKQLQP
jgi:transcriptional regulator of acetoin/glycerol metabolism